MEVSGHMNGGGPLVTKFQAGTTMSTAGIPVIGSGDAATDLLSIEPITASAALTLGIVGVSLDTSGTVAATGVTVDEPPGERSQCRYLLSWCCGNDWLVDEECTLAGLAPPDRGRPGRDWSPSPFSPSSAVR